MQAAGECPGWVRSIPEWVGSEFLLAPVSQYIFTRGFQSTHDAASPVARPHTHVTHPRTRGHTHGHAPARVRTPTRTSTRCTCCTCWASLLLLGCLGGRA